VTCAFLQAALGWTPEVVEYFFFLEDGVVDGGAGEWEWEWERGRIVFQGVVAGVIILLIDVRCDDLVCKKVIEKPVRNVCMYSR